MESLEDLSNSDLAVRIETAEPAELRRLAWELLRRLRVVEPRGNYDGAARVAVLLTEVERAALERPQPWDDPHFPEGTQEDEIFTHLETARDHRALGVTPSSTTSAAGSTRPG